MSPIEIEYEKEYLLTFEEMPEYNGVFKLKTKSNWFYELEKTFNMDDDIAMVCLFQGALGYYTYYNPYSKCLQQYMYSLRYESTTIDLVKVYVDVSIPVYGKRAIKKRPLSEQNATLSDIRNLLIEASDERNQIKEEIKTWIDER